MSLCAIILIVDAVLNPSVVARVGGHGPTMSKYSWACDLAPRLETNRGDIPMWLLLGWINIESAGKLTTHTAAPYNERGYFQITPDEAKALNLDHARLSVDADYSLQAGIKLIRHYADIARLDFTPGTDTYWRAIKFLHAIGPAAVKSIITQMRNDHAQLDDWKSIETYVTIHQQQLRGQIHHDPVKWCHNVDNVVSTGHLIVGSLSECLPKQSTKPQGASAERKN